MTEKILSDISPVYGFCPFDKIKDSLINCRSINLIPQNAQTVIVALFPYYLGEDAYDGSDISKYAVVPDYHNVICSLLKSTADKLKEAYPEDEFVAFTDNSPVPEVQAAIYAGLGVRGLNGLFINRTYGSWVFIGEIVTTKKYPIVELNDNPVCCGCNKCIDACPTHAITPDGICKDSCLSFITQKKGELTSEQKSMIKDSGCAWGCDVCQNVCPMNFKPKTDPIEVFKQGAEIKARTDSDISDRAYAWRGEKVIKRNLEIINSIKDD